MTVFGTKQRDKKSQGGDSQRERRGQLMGSGTGSEGQDPRRAERKGQTCAGPCLMEQQKSVRVDGGGQEKPP